MITAVGSRVYSFGLDFHELSIDEAPPRDDGGTRRPFWCGVFATEAEARAAWREAHAAERCGCGCVDEPTDGSPR